MQGKYIRNKLIIRDNPDRIETERLIVRVLRAGDGVEIVIAFKESHDR